MPRPIKVKPLPVLQESFPAPDNAETAAVPKKKKHRRILLHSWLVFACVFAMFTAGSVLVHNTFVTSSQDTLLGKFRSHTSSQTGKIVRELETISRTLQSTAKTFELLGEVTREEGFEILALAAGQFDELSRTYTREAEYGAFTFLERFHQPTLKDDLLARVSSYGLNPDTYPILEVANITADGMKYALMDLDNTEVAYCIAHNSRIPPMAPPAVVQQLKIFLMNFYGYQSLHDGINKAFNERIIQARMPDWVPAGYAVSVAAPVYFREDTNDPRANTTNNRGLVTVSILNTTLYSTTLLNLPIVFHLVDVESNRLFVDSSVIDHGSPVHHEVGGNVLEHIEDFQVFARTFQIRAWPEAALIEEHSPSAYTLTLILMILGSLLLAGLSAIVVYVSEKRTNATLAMLQLSRDYEAEMHTKEAEKRAHERVLGYVHHEIRNPLNIIVATMELLKHRLHELLPLMDVAPNVTPHINVDLLRRTAFTRHDSVGTHCIGSPDDPIEDHPLSLSRSNSSRHSMPSFSAGSKAARSLFVVSQQQLHQMLGELTMLEKASQHLEQHIHDMRDFQRMQRGEVALNPKAIDVGKVCKELLEFYTPRATVPLRLVGAPSTAHGLCVLDELRFRQIMVNGLLNAIKHTARGEITVAATVLQDEEAAACLANVRMSSTTTSMSTPTMPSTRLLGTGTTSNPSREYGKGSSRDGSSTSVLRLTIRDTGVGLSGASVNRLFLPFVSKRDSHDSQEERHQSGLGLAVCSLLSKSMSGGVKLEDTGQGCLFTCAFPIEMRPITLASEVKSGRIKGFARSEAPASPIDMAVPSSLKLRGLVVDDDPTNVKLVSRMLKTMGVTSYGISTGNIPELVEEALTKHGHLHLPPEGNERPLDFVLLDIRLGPTLSGVEIVRKVLPRMTNPVPIFAMTANTRGSDISEYKATGFSGLLSKPVTKSKLKTALAAVRGADVAELPLWEPR